MSVRKSAVVIGAGPAGLTAAYQLSADGIDVVVLESDPEHVGGISRTVQLGRSRCDIGGHRFFSKSAEVNALWQRWLGPELRRVPRRSRIFYGGRFFQYPLRPAEALLKLGPFESARCVLSYLAARARPIRPVVSFADWVTNEFGRRLYEIFFRTYTEKVWGMRCEDISADWAAQRIRSLSLGAAILDALRPDRDTGSREVITTLTQEFLYPRLGPGMMWDACASHVRAQGGTIRLGCLVTSCTRAESGRWSVAFTDADQQRSTIEADHVVSSAPLSSLVASLEPSPPPAMLEAASRLRYRDFLIVVLVTRGGPTLDDQWIYVHDATLRVGRIQNFRAWSPDLVDDPSHASYGLEYFCFEHDDLWQQSDEALIALGHRELQATGLLKGGQLVEGHVVRQPKAYPVYDDGYREQVACIRDGLRELYPGLHPVGRNGMHRYNNQDHAMMTGLLAARNIRDGGATYDVWAVNNEAEYLETEAAQSGERRVPQRLRPEEGAG